MTAVSSLLSLALSTNRYGSRVNDEDRQAIIDLLERLHGVGQVDLKAPIVEGVRKSLQGSTFPVAILGVGNVGLDFFVRLRDLDPHCLAAQSRGIPAFVDAVKSHVVVQEANSSSSALNESIDDILAFWARSIPVEQILWFDQPGDDPGAGLLGHIRKVGAFPDLQGALADLGFDANASRAGAMPTAASIKSHKELTAFLDNGGDLRQIVPIKWPNRPEGLELWEYIFERQNHPNGHFDLLQELGHWCKDQGAQTTKDFEEKMYWWHLRRAAKKGKADLLEFLAEHPGWADRRDHMGRNTLQVAGCLCQPFINHVLKTKALSHLLDEKDIMGHGSVAHVLPALASYNRQSDAQRMAKSLLRLRGRLRDLDENNECGLVISVALDYVCHQMSTLPSPTPLLSKSYRGRLAPLPIAWMATPEQYNIVADLLEREAFINPSLGVQDVAMCTRALFKDACEAKSSSRSSYSRDDNDTEALQVFGMMPPRLQQVIALDAIGLAPPTARPAAAMGNTPLPTQLPLEKESVAAWIRSVLSDLAVDIPQEYVAEQNKRLASWQGKANCARTIAVGELMREVNAMIQAKSLRDKIDPAIEEASTGSPAAPRF